MVGALKRWLGIDDLEIAVGILKRENLTMANSVAVLLRRKEETLESSKALTLAPEPPKIVERKPAPKRVNWSQFREARERVSEPQEDYADL